MNNKIKYRQHTLVVGSRNIDQRQRHLMKDIQAILPHSRTVQKLQSDQLSTKIPLICDEQKCQCFVTFEGSQQNQLYVWIGKYPNGPSLKFKVDNIHTIEELQLAGNFANNSRTMLSFDKKFDDNPILKLTREALSAAFKVPKTRNRNKPFVDRILQFISEPETERIWFRHYEITQEDEQPDLSEIGPRFVLTPVLILDSCMSGKEIYRNEFELSIQNKITVFNLPKQKLKRKAKLMNKLMNQLENQSIESDEIMDEEYINALKSCTRYDPLDEKEVDQDQIESADE